MVTDSTPSEGRGTGTLRDISSVVTVSTLNGTDRTTESRRGSGDPRRLGGRCLRGAFHQSPSCPFCWRGEDPKGTSVAE